MINDYDPCVANKMVDGAQITICWHVDDLKISYRDDEMVSAFAIDLAEEFSHKMTISRGEVHYYLGIDMDFESKPCTFIVSQIKYIQKIVKEFQ